MSNIFISRDNEYYTPKYVIDYFFNNNLEYDPATNELKAKEFNLKNYDTIETNGLTRDWTQFKNIWINPPFTMKNEFLIKAIETYKKAKNNIFILLPIQYLTTKKFHELNCHYKVFIPKGRINFESGAGKKGKSPVFGSVILKLEKNNSIEFIEFTK